MLDFRFLTKKEVFGRHELDILKKYGKSAYASEYSILSGCSVYKENGIIRDGLLRFAGEWWTSTILPEYYVHFICAIDADGSKSNMHRMVKYGVGCRPAISFSSIKDFCLKPLLLDCGVLEVEYGEYPQSVVSKDEASYLEKVFLARDMKETTKIYAPPFVFDKDFTEYEYNGDKYIRVVVDPIMEYERQIYNCGIENAQQFEKIWPEGLVVSDRVIYWVKVEPIKWLIDQNSDIALSKDILFANVSYGFPTAVFHATEYKKLKNSDRKEKYCFGKTSVKKHLNNYFAPSIVNDRYLYIKNKNRE